MVDMVDVQEKGSRSWCSAGDHSLEAAWPSSVRICCTKSLDVCCAIDGSLPVSRNVDQRPSIDLVRRWIRL